MGKGDKAPQHRVTKTWGGSKPPRLPKIKSTGRHAADSKDKDKGDGGGEGRGPKGDE
jgi:hypothetical protein